MKKSIRRKLIMSAVAVGAAALATTSSTYAWFVSNSTVKANDISGSVSSSEANLQISADGSTYSVKAKPTYTSTPLVPITKTTTTANFGKYENIEGVATDSGFISFKLYFRASALTDGTTYNLVLNTSESTDVDKDVSYTALSKFTSGGSEIAAGTSLTEDVTKALYLSINTEGTTSVNVPFNNAAENYDGLAYYNAVTGKEKAKPSTVTSHTAALNNLGTSGLTIGSVTASAEVKSKVFEIDFQIWLDGADKAGFDAIAGHQWSTELNFSLVSA